MVPLQFPRPAVILPGRDSQYRARFPGALLQMLAETPQLSSPKSGPYNEHRTAGTTQCGTTR